MILKNQTFFVLWILVLLLFFFLLAITAVHASNSRRGTERARQQGTAHRY